MRPPAEMYGTLPLVSKGVIWLQNTCIEALCHHSLALWRAVLMKKVTTLFKSLRIRGCYKVIITNQPLSFSYSYEFFTLEHHRNY
jgi:hypothetical protein